MLSCLASRTLLTGHISKIPERAPHVILVATRKALKNVIGEDSGRIFMSDLARATATCRRVSSVSIHQHMCQRPHKQQQTYLHIPMRKFSSSPPSPAEVVSVKKQNGGLPLSLPILHSLHNAPISRRTSLGPVRRRGVCWTATAHLVDETSRRWGLSSGTVGCLTREVQGKMGRGDRDHGID